MRSVQVDKLLTLPSARDFLRLNIDQCLNMDFRMLKDDIATKCQFQNEPTELNQLKNWIRAERTRLKNRDQHVAEEEKKFSKNQDTKEQAE